ncbi:MAG TPA: hypothetical protein VFR02_06850, partial [bacterium]|nr:hypothetical protein [bacterium]
TNTPVPPILLWPNPFNPDFAVNGELKISGLQPGDKVSFYTVSGELVAKAAQTLSGALVTWDGRNPQGQMSSAGIYYYLVQRGEKVLLRGKLLIVHQ